MVAAENTLEVYAAQVRAYVNPYLGATPLQDLTPTDLDALYAVLLERGRRDGGGLSRKTVRNVHVMLHRALEDAVAADRIKRNRGSVQATDRREVSQTCCGANHMEPRGGPGLPDVCRR